MELILYAIFFMTLLSLFNNGNKPSKREITFITLFSLWTLFICVFGYNEMIIISRQNLVKEYNQAQNYLESNTPKVEDIKVINKLNNKIQLNKHLIKYSILSKYKDEINQMKLFDLNSTEIEKHNIS